MQILNRNFLLMGKSIFHSTVYHTKTFLRFNNTWKNK